jgi:hypothetical protein
VARGRVVADGNKGGHVHDVTDAGSSSADHSMAASGSGVAVERGEGGELSAIEAAEFGQLGSRCGELLLAKGRRGDRLSDANVEPNGSDFAISFPHSGAVCVVSRQGRFFGTPAPVKSTGLLMWVER